MGSTDTGNPCSVLCCFLFGMCVLFPFALVFTGWNEQVAVCRAWAIDGAEQQVVPLNCSQHVTDTKGDALRNGTLGFLSCGVNQSTFKTFSENDFVGLAGVKNLLAPTSATAAAMQMTVGTWQCEEECSEERCDRRLHEVHSSVKGKVDESQDQRLSTNRGSRRLGKGGGGGGESCTSRCVAWRHKRVLSSSMPTTDFQDYAGAVQVCGNPPVSSVTPPVRIGTSDVHANAGQVSTLPGNAWVLNEKQLQELPIEVPVVLTPRAASAMGAVNSATSAPVTLDQSNTYVEGNTLKTCKGVNSNSMGCLEISFQKATPAQATMLGAISNIPGQMNKEGWNEDGYWACKGSHANNINRFCPSKPQADLNDAAHKGSISCGEDVTTMEELFTIMKNANSMKLWIFRAIGFFCFWLAICCCLQPIESCLGFITNMMDEGTDCIPGVGCAVDCLTDIFMGMVKAVLCVVGCCCAAGWFLSVVVVMWIVMRPVMGMALAVVACCFCAGAGVVLHMCKGGRKRGLDDDEDMSDLISGGEDNE